MTKHQSDVATFGNVSGRSSESKIETLISSRCFSRPRTWLKTTWPRCHDTSTAEKLFHENVGKMGIEKERIVHFLWGTCLKRYSWLWIGLAVWTCFPFSDIIYTYYIYNYNYYNCIILYLYVGLYRLDSHFFSSTNMSFLNISDLFKEPPTHCVNISWQSITIHYLTTV